MKYTAKELGRLFGATVEGDETVEITALARIEDAPPGSLTFLHNLKYAPYLYDCQASAVLTPADFKPERPVRPTLIRVAEPYMAFYMLLKSYRDEKTPAPGISEHAIVHPTAEIGKDVYIGPYVVVDARAKLGDGVKIYPFVYVGPDVRLGDETVVYPHAVIHADVQIGRRCVVHSGAVVGGEGFGFVPQDGTQAYVKVPQVGNVVLEDEVEIGSNTCVDRAMLGSTILRRGVKLDNLIQIGHNVEIGENTAMAAMSGVSGSAKIGKNCMIGGQAGIIGHLSLGDGVKLGAQTGVTKSIPEAGVYRGSPAYPLRKQLEMEALQRRLPEMYKKLQALEAKIKDMEQKIQSPGC
ncbi:MAG: UDP-3-O-(3-hydroxymyristoyl)glucosamine N-acyltransferase [Bacteroidia bacterium]|nr:UDP-3-O-(3-hydroxymyristoyl)glucosamine N-acyltransferase [Bacteroidia bacterium]MDW8333497.1 UDP-3-O-(3-hydroxymyristoyl)glucosamine N-acyltransferase [Bacteroidia bacterium]